MMKSAMSPYKALFQGWAEYIRGEYLVVKRREERRMERFTIRLVITVKGSDFNARGDINSTHDYMPCRIRLSSLIGRRARYPWDGGYRYSCKRPFRPLRHKPRDMPVIHICQSVK